MHSKETSKTKELQELIKNKKGEIVIKFKIIKRDAVVICSDIRTVFMLLGTSINYNLIDTYKINEKDDGYHVPILAIEKRIKILNERKKRLEEYLEIMQQALGY